MTCSEQALEIMNKREDAYTIVCEEFHHAYPSDGEQQFLSDIKNLRLLGHSITHFLQIEEYARGLLTAWKDLEDKINNRIVEAICQGLMNFKNNNTHLKESRSTYTAMVGWVREEIYTALEKEDLTSAIKILEDEGIKG